MRRSSFARRKDQPRLVKVPSNFDHSFEGDAFAHVPDRATRKYDAYVCYNTVPALTERLLIHGHVIVATKTVFAQLSYTSGAAEVMPARTAT